MIWKDYYNSYMRFELAVNQACVVAKAADSILQDFPDHLPKDWQEKIKVGESTLATVLQEFIKHGPNEATLPSTEGFQLSSDVIDSLQYDAPEIVRPILNSYANACALEYPRQNLRFNEQVYVQQLVMTFAYLDAFIGDSVRAICSMCPDVMKSSKKADWEAIISAGSWERLLQNLVDQYVYQFGFDSVVKRLDKMNHLFGLRINLAERIALVLEGGELVRNLFVHNGGQISQKFIDSTQRLHLQMGDELIPGHSWIRIIFVDDAKIMNQEEHSLKLGESLFCDSIIADGVATYAKVVAGEVFTAVSVKFFGKNEDVLTGVTRQACY